MLRIEQQRAFEAFGKQTKHQNINSTVDGQIDMTNAQQIENALNNYNEYSNKIQEAQNKITSLEQSGIENNKEEIIAIGETIDYYTNLRNVSSDTLLEMGKQLSTFVGLEAFENSPYKGLYDDIMFWADSVKIADDTISNANMTLEEQIDNIGTFEEKYDDSISTLENMYDSFENLSNAVDDYNSSNGNNIDAILELVQMDEEYLSLLEMENGQLVLNKDAILTMAMAKIEDAKMSAINATQARILDIAQNGVAESATNASVALSNSIISIDSAGNACLNNIGKVTGLAGAYATLNSIMSGEDGSDAKSAIEQEMANLNTTLDLLDSFGTSITNFSFTGGGGKTSAKKTTAKKTTDILKEQSDVFDNILEKMEHILFLDEKRGASSDVILGHYKALQDEVERQIAWFKSKGVAENSEYIRDLEKQWWGYHDEIVDIHKEILDKQKDDYETSANTMIDQIDKRIEAIEKEKQAIEEATQAEIDKLKEKNDLIEDSIRLSELEEQLAKAKNTKSKVLVDGKFQYIANENDVAEAYDELKEYEREKALEDEIKALEENRDKELGLLDDKIKNWEEYKSQWEDILDDYSNAQDLLIAEQILGVDLEKMTWDNRLQNLEEFKEKYTKILADLDMLEKDPNKVIGDNTPTSSKPSGSSGKSSVTADVIRDVIQGKYGNGSSRKANIEKAGYNYSEVQALVNDYYKSGKSFGSWKATAFAMGVDSVKSDTLALVGDNPNYQELVVGSKWNKNMGIPLNLPKGTGVLPANQTKSLTSLLSNFATSVNPLGFNKNNPHNSTMINVDRIIVEGVQDAEGFAREVVNKFKNYTIQTVY